MIYNIWVDDRCVAVHQGKKLMYDARLCQRKVLTSVEMGRVAEGLSSNHPLNTSDLVPSCLLAIQPLSLISIPSAVSTTFTQGAQRLNMVPALELSSGWDLATIGSNPDSEQVVVCLWSLIIIYYFERSVTGTCESYS